MSLNDLKEAPRFDGQTYDHERDGERLTSQLNAVKKAMMDQRPHSLFELAQTLGYPESSIGARLRDLRKSKFGGWVVERSYVNKGLFLYTLKPAPMPTL